MNNAVEQPVSHGHNTHQHHLFSGLTAFFASHVSRPHDEPHSEDDHVAQSAVEVSSTALSDPNETYFDNFVCRLFQWQM